MMGRCARCSRPSHSRMARVAEAAGRSEASLEFWDKAAFRADDGLSLRDRAAYAGRLAKAGRTEDALREAERAAWGGRNEAFAVLDRLSSGADDHTRQRIARIPRPAPEATPPQ